MPRQARPPMKSTAAPRSGAKGGTKTPRPPGGPSTRPGGVPLKRPHIERARRDVERGLKDTDRRGTPNDVPKG